MFTAPAWCIPCRRFEPHFEAASKNVEGYTFVRVIMGETPEDTGAHWATEAYGVLGVPHVIRTNRYGSTFPVKARTIVTLIKELT